MVSDKQTTKSEPKTLKMICHNEQCWLLGCVHIIYLLQDSYTSYPLLRKHTHKKNAKLEDLTRISTNSPAVSCCITRYRTQYTKILAFSYFIWRKLFKMFFSMNLSLAFRSNQKPPLKYTHNKGNDKKTSAETEDRTRYLLRQNKEFIDIFWGDKMKVIIIQKWFIIIAPRNIASVGNGHKLTLKWKTVKNDEKWLKTIKIWPKMAKTKNVPNMTKNGKK